MQILELQKSLLSFTEASLAWCTAEAEQGTERVSKAIDMLLQNIARVTQVSKDSLDALENLQAMLKAPESRNIQQLKKSLSALSKEHDDINSFIEPILSSLQFQDRLRQNLENIVKMLKQWQETRQDMGTGMDAKTLQDFGRKLNKLTTMKRERDVVRSQIEGLDPEVEADSVLLF